MNYTNPDIEYPFNPTLKINSQYNMPLYMIHSIVERPNPNYSTVSAHDCAEEEHERVMTLMRDKEVAVEVKQKNIRDIVRQRKREEAEETLLMKKKEIEAIFETQLQFMQLWDRRILEETQEKVETYPNVDPSVPSHYIVKHEDMNGNSYADDLQYEYEDEEEQEYEFEDVKRRTTMDDLNQQEENYDGNGIDEKEDQYEQRDIKRQMNQNKILQDPLTPNVRDVATILNKSKKLTKINNIVNDEYTKLSEYVRDKINSLNDIKMLERLRIYSINKIAAIKSRQNVQIKQMNKVKKQKVTYEPEYNENVTQPQTSIKKEMTNPNAPDSVPKKSKMLAENQDELNYTNAKSGLSLTSNKKHSPSKNAKPRKNMFDIQERHDSDKSYMLAGITRHIEHLDRIVWKGEQKENLKENNASPDKDSWLDMSERKEPEMERDEKYEKYINALGKLCQDKDFENQFVVDI